MSFKIRVILLVFVCCSWLTSYTQLGMGEWRMHISPNNAIGVVKANNAIYAALPGGVLEYDLTAGEKTTMTAANFLSDVNISAIGHDQQTDMVCIGYTNGNLDIFDKETVYNLPAILTSSVSGVKRINNMTGRNKEMFLATGFGIVVINLEKREVKDTYYPTGGLQQVIDVTFANDSIYALTPNKIYSALASNLFLADPAQWNELANIPDYISTGSYNVLTAFNNELYLGYNDEIYNSDTLFKIENGQLDVVLDELELFGLSVTNEKLVVGLDGSLKIFNTDLEEEQAIFQYNHTSFPGPVTAVFDEGFYYIADRRSGLVRAQNAFSSLNIDFEGPRYSSSYRVDWQAGKLGVAAGRLNANNPAFSNEGGASFQDELWTSINPGNQPMLQGAAIWDFISVAVNPNNTDEIAFGTYSGIPLVVSDNGTTITDTFGFSNSNIEPTVLGNGWGQVTDITYDNDGNMWFLNASTQRPLKVYTEEGEWLDFNLGNSVSNRLTRRLLIDNNGYKWFGVEGAGVMAFDDNGTLGDASDDRYRILNTGENSGNLPSSTVEAIAVDLDNNIWVGTEEGMRVLFNSFNVFDAAAGEYNFQRLLIEFGENVEIVLGTTHITDIEIDGANRKWIGTQNAGVFLFSSDGLELIENFTAQNSPLLSNAILDIAIDQNTGETYFVTDEGMISYRSDASQGDRNYANVKVFPNPVYPDYFGPITIQGIASNSMVKITDLSGKLVYETQSNGGTAVWDGLTLDGKRATTGVYLIWTAVDLEGVRGRAVGKVVFVN